MKVVGEYSYVASHIRHVGSLFFSLFIRLTSVMLWCISFISAAYCVTDNTPPCLMLSLMLIVLVLPYFVLILAFRSLFRISVASHSAPFIPILCMMYIMASIQAVWKEPLTSWPDVKLPPQTNKQTIYPGLVIFLCHV